MTTRYEKEKLKQGYLHIIGCDEVGRGCLAGPVVAAAVVLKVINLTKWFSEINDSKKLTAEKREYLSELIKSQALWSVGEVSSEVVDKINIHNASLLAMNKAVEGLFSAVILESRSQDFKSAMSEIHFPSSGSRTFLARNVPGQKFRDDTQGLLLAIDGKFKVPNLDMHQQAIIGGDNKVLSIAAASIIAKVYRDELMAKLHSEYPVYNFRQHKGYATKYHRAMVIKNGLSPIHRLTFCQNLSV